jgi:hypothetical protein
VVVSFLLVPHEATSSSVTAWVGVVGDPPGTLQLGVGGRQPQALPGDGWSVWQVHGRPAFWSQRMTIKGLDPGRRYPLSLSEGGTGRATGTAVTLPDRLPRLDEDPFICLLGSCFAHFADQAGAAGAAYAALPAGARPSVKFLCGDQVYLDAPFPRFLINVLGEDDLQAELLATYVTTWAQSGDAAGFAELLRAGATWFGSDDHEVWNNAPMATPTVRATWWPFGDHGAAWWRIATALYDEFQTPRRSAGFRVGNLSFHVLDTRLGRSADRSRFADPQHLAALDGWVTGLDGPGVVVVGQPIFVPPTGPRGHFTDWGLADYGQYAELVRTVARSQHDLLVLTGDVHYGRISGTTLPSGASLIEVIASPFALVDPRVGGKWHAPPQVFPAAPLPGVTQSAVWFEQLHNLAVNQFATLEFAADGSRVRASVRAWPIPPPGQAPVSSLVFQRPLQ